MVDGVKGCGVNSQQTVFARIAHLFESNASALKRCVRRLACEEKLSQFAKGPHIDKSMYTRPVSALKTWDLGKGYTACLSGKKITVFTGGHFNAQELSLSSGVYSIKLDSIKIHKGSNEEPSTLTFSDTNPNNPKNYQLKYTPGTSTTEGDSYDTWHANHAQYKESPTISEYKRVTTYSQGKWELEPQNDTTFKSGALKERVQDVSVSDTKRQLIKDLFG